MKVISFNGRGMSGAGACTATGAAVGDRVAAVIGVLPGGRLEYLDAGSFEPIITVQDQIQQSAVGYNVFSQAGASPVLTDSLGNTVSGAGHTLGARPQVAANWSLWNFIALLEPGQVASASGAITLKEGTVYLTKAGVAAMTIADPTAVTDDGKELNIISTTANAHTVSNAAGSGFNSGGSGTDVGTFGGAIGDGMTLKAYGGKWLVVALRNVTLG